MGKSQTRHLQVNVSCRLCGCQEAECSTSAPLCWQYKYSRTKSLFIFGYAGEPLLNLRNNSIMTLRYIFHSGFLLETERCILVFDYWMDPTDVMREYLHTSKRVYVFASHFHEDHFTKEIFSWKESIQDMDVSAMAILLEADNSSSVLKSACSYPCISLQVALKVHGAWNRSVRKRIFRSGV